MRKIFLLLAVIGAALAGSATYLQATSMDLTRYSLRQYLEAGIVLEDWRAVVMYPFIFGLAYIFIGIVCLYRRPSPRVVFVVVCSCFLLAVLLRFVSEGFGIYALFSMALVVSIFLAELRTEKALVAAPLVVVLVGTYLILTKAYAPGILLMILVPICLLEIRKKRAGG